MAFVIVEGLGGRTHLTHFPLACVASSGFFLTCIFSLPRRVRFSLPTHFLYHHLPFHIPTNHLCTPRLNPRAHPPFFVGNAPYLSMLQRLCAQLGVDAILMGQLTGRGLGEAVGSADVIRWVFHLGFTLFGGNEE
jgi:hypothetical protein